MGAFISAIESINNVNNYVYDAEGRLVKDRQEEIDTILWTVTGKVKEIHRTDTSKKRNLSFEYASPVRSQGNAIGKRLLSNPPHEKTKIELYTIQKFV